MGSHEISVNEEGARVLILPRVETSSPHFLSSRLIPHLIPPTLFINTTTHLPHIIMENLPPTEENPPPVGETPKKKKKRNPSFRRYLRNHGIDVVSSHVFSSLSPSHLLVVPWCWDAGSLLFPCFPILTTYNVIPVNTLIDIAPGC